MPLAALVLAATATQVGATTLERIKETGVMTVCADPANLPVSDSNKNPPGYDLEIAEETAKSLGAKLNYHWFATAHIRRVLRQLYDEKCDFVVGIPLDKRLEGAGPQLALSKPYLTTGFVVVVGKDVQAKGLDDLKGKRIGVEMHSVPDFALFSLGHERGLYASQAEIFKALADGEIPAAVMWAPIAGWLLKQQPSVQLTILPESRAEFTFPLAVAVRKGDPQFLDVINKAIDAIVSSGRRDQILDKYGFPKILSDYRFPEKFRLSEERREPESHMLLALDIIRRMTDVTPVPHDQVLAMHGFPILLADNNWSDDHLLSGKRYDTEPRMMLAVGGTRKMTDETATDAPAMGATTTDAPTSGATSASRETGYDLYHRACGKCHGRSAISGGIYPDLRKFEGSDEDFLNTTKNGRAGTMMPPWKGVFSEEELLRIRSYVNSVKKD